MQQQLMASMKTFHGQMMSLPGEEQEDFRNYRHPSQDLGMLGFNAARSCANALSDELKDNSNVKLIEPAYMSGAWIIRVVATAKIETLGLFYRGFIVRQSVYHEEAKA